MVERAFSAFSMLACAPTPPDAGTLNASEPAVWPSNVRVKVPDAPVTVTVCTSDRAFKRAKLPALRAGLVGSRANVWVGPPKFPRADSCGLSGDAIVPVRSEPTQPELPSVLPTRLLPREVIDPSTSGLVA